jgi:hypothetical protein
VRRNGAPVPPLVGSPLNRANQLAPPFLHTAFTAASRMAIEWPARHTSIVEFMVHDTRSAPISDQLGCLCCPGVPTGSQCLL